MMYALAYNLYRFLLLSTQILGKFSNISPIYFN